MADDWLSGRELDLAVAERVMGRRWFHCVAATGVERNQLFTAEQVETWRSVGWSATEIPSPPPADQFNDGSDVPRYGESIEAAMQVVEKLNRRMEVDYFPGSEMPWCVMFVNSQTEAAWAETFPRAICRAALAAIGGSGE